MPSGPAERRFPLPPPPPQQMGGEFCAVATAFLHSPTVARARRGAASREHVAASRTRTGSIEWPAADLEGLRARAGGGSVGKEMTHIRSAEPSNPWPHLVEYYGQEDPEPEITAARAKLGISVNDLTIGTEDRPQASGSSTYCGSIVAKRKVDLQKLCAYLLSRGWTIRKDLQWTLRRHTPSWESEPP
jgi:hypothetical protein